MKLRSQDDAERKASSIAQKLRAKNRGDLVSKMGLHADKVLARHNSNIEQHMKRTPDASAHPESHAEWQKKLDKHNRFSSYWSGVSSGFRKHDPFFDHVGTHGTYKESTDMPKTEQDIIAEAVDELYLASRRAAHIEKDEHGPEQVQLYMRTAKDKMAHHSRAAEIAKFGGNLEDHTEHQKLHDAWKSVHDGYAASFSRKRGIKRGPEGGWISSD